MLQLFACNRFFLPVTAVESIIVTEEAEATQQDLLLNHLPLPYRPVNVDNDPDGYQVFRLCL